MPTRALRAVVVAAIALCGFGPGRAGAVAHYDPPAAVAGQGQPQTAGGFRVRFDPAVLSAPYSGRVYVVLSKHPTREPRLDMNSWFASPQIFAVDVSKVDPREGVVVRDAVLAFPQMWSAALEGEYTAQAVARASVDHPKPGVSEGDLYSAPVPVRFSSGADGTLELTIEHAVPRLEPKEDERTRYVEIESPSLSAFAGRRVTVRAGVRLPAGWADDPSRAYQTVYFITGFGGDHRNAARMGTMLGPASDDVLVVVPDPSCFRGHSVFADSANNGPRGESLMRELLPEVERRFHGAKDASRRFVTGISSGGWSALWLQVTYPDSFAGAWAHCPDPVDFRDFQSINLYGPEANMYRDERGQRRPLARRSGASSDEAVAIWYDDFVRQETVLGPGGQIHSFEAVFSPRLLDGRPAPLFDRETGAVDPEIAHSWEAYDIGLILQRRWSELGPKLAGKLHIYAGERDTFYLEGSVRRLAETLKTLGSDARVVVVPGMAHTMWRDGVGEMFRTLQQRRSDPTPAAAAATTHEPAGAAGG